MQNSNAIFRPRSLNAIAILAGITRAYLRHLCNGKEIFGFRLTTFHNLYFLLRLMEKVREAIRQDRLLDFGEQFIKQYYGTTDIQLTF